MQHGRWLPVWTEVLNSSKQSGDIILLIYKPPTQTPPQSSSSAHDTCTTPMLAGHVRVHVNHMCGDMWRAETEPPRWAQGGSLLRFTSGFLRFHLLSSSKILASSSSPVRSLLSPMRGRAERPCRRGILSKGRLSLSRTPWREEQEAQSQRRQNLEWVQSEQSQWHRNRKLCHRHVII